MKKLLFLLMTLLLGWGNLWADSFAWDLSANESKATTTTNGIVTITFGGSNLSAQRTYMGFKNGSTLSISSVEGYTITAIAFTYESSYVPKTSSFTASPTGLNSECTSWTGGASSIAISNTTSSNDTRITNISVTYSTTVAPEYSYVIPVEDLRYTHGTYEPKRTGIYGLTLEATGWQSYTNTSTSPYEYTLLLSSAKSSNFKVTSTSANITKVVLVGASGAGTFSNVISTGTDTYTTTDADQMVWQGSSAASEATVSFTTSTGQPQINQIWVFTNTALSDTKQSVTLSFNPASETNVNANVTDYQIQGLVTASVGGIDNGNFRPDNFTSSSVANDGSSNVSFNQYHISTAKVGVNTGSTPGTATITTTFAGNQFYEAATSGSYSMTISAASTTSKTFTVNDMRISKTANTNGLNATSGLDRTVGGFSFEHTGGEGVKFNNGDFLILRYSDAENIGKTTITPVVSSGTVNISSVTINTMSGYTTGTVTATGTDGNIDLTGLSSYTFKNVNSSTFELTAVSGNVYIQSYTIYYSGEGTLNETNTVPSITFMKNSASVNGTTETVNSGDSYTSPTITTVPANFDITLSSDNTDVATVKTSNWTSAPLVSLMEEVGTATITASATSSTFFDAATNATYAATYVDTSAEKWNFTSLNVTNTITNDRGWNNGSEDVSGWEKSGEYYQNIFTSSNKTDNSTYAASSGSQLEDLKFGRENNSGLAKGQIRLYTSYMEFRNSAIWVDVPVAANQSVILTYDYNKSSGTGGFNVTNATVEGTGATTITTGNTPTTVTLNATSAGTVRFQATTSNVRIYRIQVKSESRKTLDLRDSGSNTYEVNVGTGNTASTNNHFNHRVTYTPSDGAASPVTYANDASNFTITSSDPSVLDVSNAYINESNFGNSSSFYFNNIIPLAAGTATLTVTFNGNSNYKPNSYTSQVYTVSGPLTTFQIEAEDQEIQQGQFSTISPKLTDASGKLLGIKQMSDGTGRYTTYILDEEEAVPDYSEYFTYSFTAGATTGSDNADQITVDGTGKIETENNDGSIKAAVGDTRKISITATPKATYASAFASEATANTEITITIIPKVANVQVDLYWDAACSEEQKISTYDDGTDTWSINTEYAHQDTDKLYIFDSNGTGIFKDAFPNGRMIYAKVRNEGDSIWFSYAQNASAAVIPANPKIDKNKRIFEYRRGIPIYIDDDLTGSDYVTVNIVATSWDANTRKRILNGSVARMKFPNIISHARPAQPTYDPISPDATASENKDGRKIMNTSENVVAYGEGASKTNPTGNSTLVYGKFSTGTVYTTEMLINENAVQRGIGSVPVVSTEVAKRRFTSVQIKNYAAVDDDGFDGGDYISEQTYTEYWYLYDTDLRLYSDAERTTAYPNQNIDINSSTTQPYHKVTWYNKRNYDDPKNYNLGVTQEVDDYAGKITYTISDYGGLSASDVEVNATTGVVTSKTSNEGRIKVTATYLGGEQHGGKSGEPQYTSTTDESTADFYVYVYNTANERPIITPTTRSFTEKMTFNVKAPTNWEVRYTTDGSDPTTEIGTILAKNTNIDWTIGNVTTDNDAHTIHLDIDNSITVKAIAYNSDKTMTSAIVSEKYTRKYVPDPIFDPDGTQSTYEYNTNDLLVQIACAYPGAVIYYTITDTETGSFPDPVIGADNTYKYSGLSKVTVTGNKTIKAVAYDPIENIYSNIVTSVYGYSSEMLKPYFQIYDETDGKWYGYNTENSTEWVANGKSWYNGQSKDITPSTQIRIVDPNPVTGTIFYTLNGVDPADNATTMVYAEGYPFTVGKTTTGKARTILEDAQSDVSSAVFTINTETYGNVWEAVGETMTDSLSTGKRHGIHIADGFVISQDKDLKVANTGSIVHLKSIDTSHSGTSSKMYAQPDITATFGGYDLASWEQMEIADAATGAPIGNIGEYSIKTINNTDIGNGNAKDEKKDNYNHIYSYKTDADKANTSSVTAATTHEKTFKLPAIGDYVRFEPEKDGDLTIWVLQQGALLYEDDTYFVDNVLRIRPVYMVDEQGKSQKVKVVNNVPQMWSAARLSENWAKIQATAASNSWKNSRWTGPGNDDYDTNGADYVQYVRVSDGTLYNSLPTGGHSVSKLSEIPDGADKSTYYKKLVNKGPNREETAAIYNMYKADLDKNYVNVGDPIKPFAIHTGATISLNDNRIKDDSDDGTGYVLASGGFAKYTFELKAGKTYFFFAQGSKIGIRGFQFVPTENTATRPEVSMNKTLTTVTVDGVSKTLDEAITACAGKTVNVTLSNRSFTTNWTTLVLPFSVSVAQIEKVFGEKTDIVIFDDITGATHNTIHMTRHWHKMIVAGTPVLIKPTTAVDNPIFNGVQLEASAIDEITGSCDDFTMTGTFVKSTGALKPNDWYVNGSGNFTYLKGDANVDVNGSYTWLRKKAGVAAKMLMTDMSSIFDEDNGETTGIIDVELPAGNENVNILNYDTNVYNVKGQIVSQGSLQNLPKGVYIVNGKKVVVK